MSCKDALLANFFYVGFGSPLKVWVADFLLEKRETQKSRMTFIHVEGRKFVMAKPPQKLYTTDPEHRLLAQTVVPVASVELIGEGLIPWRVIWKARIQQVNRNVMTARTTYPVSPGTHYNSPAFDT
jgi:hypothetical protein